MGENRSAYRVLVGKPEAERSTRRSEDNIEMNIRKIGW
jgi:hypothetical protein